MQKHIQTNMREKRCNHRNEAEARTFKPTKQTREKNAANSTKATATRGTDEQDPRRNPADLEGRMKWCTVLYVCLKHLAATFYSITEEQRSYVAETLIYLGSHQSGCVSRSFYGQ